MKASIKTLQDIGGLHDLKTYSGAVKKSGKPDLPTTAILDLYMRRNERDRLVKELRRLRRRGGQLRRRLREVEKEMTKLLEKATKTAVEIRGEKAKSKNSSSSSSPGKRERLVLRY